MCRHRLAGPQRTGFGRGIVADREHEIECGASGSANSFQDFERKPDVSYPRLCRSLSVSGCTCALGWLPAL